ncbi:MAG: class I SAM-dependent methyltransferase [Candidatus Nanoarchaeia archaeon]|nr:class I SAM-dependent methyltransferase [Candidatus Nanoarchaeia archaeon]
MRIESQEGIWDKIAPEWYELKTNPDKEVLGFLSKQKGNILDFGSGAGRHFINLKTKSKMWLVDFSKEMIKLAKRRAKKLKIKPEFFVSDLQKTKFEDNFFDAAIFIASLHCIPTARGREKTVKELFRILKPKTEVMISVWNKNARRFINGPKEKFIAWRNIGKRYYYLFEPEEVYNLFEKIGFKIKKKFKPDMGILFIAQKP